MRFKELRKKEQKTQQEIANILNVSQQTYAKYELGVCEPTIETLSKLANFYGVTVDYLIGRDANEFAYLSAEEKTLIVNFRKLSTYNQAKIVGEVAGILLTQN